MKRQFPPDLEQKMTEDEKNLTEFERLFSNEWLSKDLGTPVHKLWNDPSSIASLEMYLVDQCMRSIREISDGWIKSTRRSIVNCPDSRHIAGALAEIIFAGAFSEGGNDVELGSQSSPV
tara:strand:+ start:2098 stop:2454 length:357 start_codon:yes stop_codon:yes gene_type:complete